MKSPFKASRKRSRGAAPSRYAGAVTVLVVIAFWFLFAPFQVGGSASYVIVNGNSMEKGFSRGDLVITRKQGTGEYEVGDVVAYLHPQIGPVIHRIVGENDGRFVLKGDNNDWLDSYQPVEDEMIGESWLHIPHAGKVLGMMHSPVGILALSLTMGVIVMMSFSTNKNSKNSRNSRNSRNRRNSGPDDPVRPNWATLAGRFSGGDGPPGKVSKEAEGYATLFGALLLASVFLAFFAFTRPATVPVSGGDVGFQNTGEFDYTANVPTDIYESGKVASGEPIFRTVTDEVEMNFDYRLDSALPTGEIEGTYRLDAKVSDVNGWSRTFQIQPETNFSGGEFTASGILDLARIQEVTSTLEEETGVETDRYAVSIVPDVNIGGQLDGQPIEDTFSPSLDFWLDDNQMQLQTPLTTGAATEDATATVGTDEPTADPLSASEEGSAASNATEANKLSIFGLEIGVAFARILALLGVGVSILGLVRFGLPVLRARQSDDEPTRIAATSADSLVSVNDNPFGEDTSVITLSAFEDLVKISEMSEQKILHKEDEHLHDYYVLDGERVYHYRAIALADRENDEGKSEEPGKQFMEMVREMWR